MKNLVILFGLVGSLFISFSCSTGKKSESQIADTVKIDSLSTSNATNQSPETNSRETDTTSFTSFIELFQQTDATLPGWAIESFLEMENIGHVTAKDILETDPVYVVLFVHSMPVGPGIDKLYAASFSQGKLISKIQLGSSYPSSGPDGGGMDYAYSYNAKNHILTVTNSSIDWDEQSQQDVTTEKIQLFQITNEGNLTNPRAYPEVSERLLDKSELTGKTKEELMIMRNEPFAVYGYTFKNAFLKNYFASKGWYTPRFDNVNDQLSEVEKANIKLIKEIEETNQ
ncbi:MAG: YARHG domain-containing protein [Bacteroidetes bacterium]|nr:YARHG domain-containing protein [Bacteroidota bacterium]